MSIMTYIICFDCKLIRSYNIHFKPKGKKDSPGEHLISQSFSSKVSLSALCGRYYEQ
ncbi:MAG: hypothetical protein C5S41_02365 [Candidatus Methanomarinus sp.]|nr:MAG: hypothetical protein C5S41_02365 [ANME-2 cluster archaeon]